jgi:hypothetical protein
VIEVLGTILEGALLPVGILLGTTGTLNPVEDAEIIRRLGEQRAPAPRPEPRPIPEPQPRPKEPETDRCPVACKLVGPLPRIGGHPWHEYYASSLGSGEWELVHPFGLSARYDSMKDTLGIKTMIEAKTDHTFMWNQRSHEYKKAHPDLLGQFSLQASVAHACRYSYMIAVDNRSGAAALNKAFPGFPVYYVPPH